MSQRRIAIVLVTAAALICGCTISQLALAQERQAEKGAIIINLTSGREDLRKATMALQLASHALADGHKAVVFLNVRGVELAAADQAGVTGINNNPPPGEMLAKLIDQGATVLVCPSCLEVAGMKKEQLMKGAQLATRESLFGQIGANSAVFSY